MATRSTHRRLRRAVARALAAAAAASATCALGAVALGACDGDASDATTSSNASSSGAAPPDASDGDADASDPCAPVRFDPEVPDTCGSYVRFPCGLPPEVEVQEGCFIPLAVCDSLCLDLYFSCHATDDMCDDAGVFQPRADGTVDVDCVVCPGGIGRVPAGLTRAAHPVGPSPIGLYFARMARLERASVRAFERLADELRAHGAPPSLVRRSLASAREERGHGRAAARLARRYGALPPIARVRDVGGRSLEDLATENAVEGCVRETFGALLAAHQAAHAADPAVRRVLSRIAVEEGRHAALSLDVLTWSLTKLDDRARRRLRARARAAISEITGGSGALDPATEEALGLPGRAARAAMAATLRADLWEGAFGA